MRKPLYALIVIALVGFGLSQLTSDEEPSADRGSQRGSSPLGNADSPTRPGVSHLGSHVDPLVSRAGPQNDSLENPEPPGQPLPFDPTVPRIVTDEETGEEKIWKLTNREIAREDRPGRVLPAPNPRESKARESKANAETESARALESMAIEARKRGDVARAMELFEEDVKSDPYRVRAHSDYGRLLRFQTATKR